MFGGKAREVRLRRFVLKRDREDVRRMLRMELPGRRFRGRHERSFRDMVEDTKVEKRMQRAARWRRDGEEENSRKRSPEQVIHDVLVVLHSVLWEVARCEKDYGIHLISIVT